jgi:ribonucleoside-diphosphate reductase beta chain
MANDWKPKEVDMTRDLNSYKDLLPGEKRGYDLALAQLIFMDSIQTNNSADNVNPWITAPEANQCIVRQAQEEGTHSESYGVMVESVSPNTDLIYKKWKDDPVLREKNEYIGKLYEKFAPIANEDISVVESRTALDWSIYELILENKITMAEKFPRIYSVCSKFESYDKYLESEKHKNFEAKVYMIVANQILEGIYFYAGFILIYALGRMNKMVNSVKMIKFINRDEDAHVALYGNIFKIIHREYRSSFTDEMYSNIRKMIKDAVILESNWGEYITQDQILGLSTSILDKYIKYLANTRVKLMGLESLIGLPYPEIGLDNPMPWVDSFKKFEDQKTDFFHGDEMNYDHSSLGYSDDDDDI